MKTFVSDDYQVTLMDNGGVDVYIGRNLNITYNPNNEKNTWTLREDYDFYGVHNITTSQNITGLGLLKPGLVALRKALEIVGRQDIMDNEIVLVVDMRRK